MPTTDLTPSISSIRIRIVSPSLNPVTRTLSFTMLNFTTVTNINFEFGPHHYTKLKNLNRSLNNIYFECLDDAFVTSLFTDSQQTTFKDTAINLIRTSIIDIIVANSRAI